MVYLHLMTKTTAVESTTKFDQLLRTSAQLPGVQINRENFLRRELKPFCTTSQIDCAVATSPAEAGVSLEVVNRIATSAVKNEATKVTLFSTATGLPGGLALVGTVPADLAQYYGHVLRIVQKLAYIYSWPDLFDGDGPDSATENMLTLFIGVMCGVSAAQVGVTKTASMIAQQMVKTLPQKALTKGIIYPVVKKVSTKLGAQMTKQIFAKGASKVVPVVGAAISGGLTFATFLPMAKRLQKHLSDLPLVTEQAEIIDADMMWSEES